MRSVPCPLGACASNFAVSSTFPTGGHHTKGMVDDGAHGPPLIVDLEVPLPSCYESMCFNDAVLDS